MKKCLFAVTALTLCSPLLAQENSDTARRLDGVVVTANRLPQKQNSTGKVVTVIGSEELRRSVGRSLPELLNTQAGITVIGAQNNLGTNQDVFLQGAASGRTLLLVDGVPAYDPSTISNAFDLNHFSIDNIERIEIVKGAMSTLYGSDALGGVINIISKKGGSKPLSLYATTAAGSYGTFKNVAGINGQKGNSSYGLQYSHLSSRGFSSAYDSTGRQGFDNDGFNQHVLSANFRTAVGQRLSWQANGQWSRYATDLDADRFTDEKDYSATSKNLQLSTGLHYRFGAGKLVLQYNYNQTRRTYLDDSSSVGGFARYTRQRYLGAAHLVEAYSHVELSPALTLLLGADYRFQNTDQFYYAVSAYGPYESARSADSTKMQQYSGYASLLYKNRSGFYLELGGRYNHHSVYGGNATYSFNPSYLLGKSVKLFANLASGFKAPTLYQMFVVGGAQGQPLRAETSRTLDGGIEYNGGHLHARALYFLRQLRNGIEYNLASFNYFNNNRQRDRGLELEAGWKKGKVSMTAAYNFVSSRVNTVNFVYNPNTFGYEAKGDTAFNNGYRRPQHSLNLQLGVAPMPALYLSLHARLVGRRLEPIFAAAPVVLQPYHSADLYAEYKLKPQLRLFADLRNISNQRYFDVWGYNTRRFNFTAGINLQW